MPDVFHMFRRGHRLDGGVRIRRIRVRARRGCPRNQPAGSARTLLDVLSEAAARIREGADPTLLARERELQLLLHTKSERRTVLLGSARTEAHVSVLDRDIDQLLAEYRELQNRIRTSSPRYAALAHSDPLSTAEIQRTLDPSSR